MGEFSKLPGQLPALQFVHAQELGRASTNRLSEPNTRRTCAVLSQIMSFSGTAAKLDSANLSAGSQYGSTLLLESGGSTSGYEFVNTVMPPVDKYAARVTSYLSYLGVKVSNTDASGLSNSPTPMIQGSFTFSPMAWAEIVTFFGGSDSARPTELSNVTVCNLSIMSGLYLWNTMQGRGTLYGGYIFMTINGKISQFPI
jgi:hypothetical protein